MRILVKLECEHITMVNPARIHDPWMCPVCNVAKRAVDIITDEIHVRCHVMMGKKRCTFSRWVGLSSITGNEVANRHASMCNHHTVTVQKETNPEAARIRAKLVKRGLIGCLPSKSRTNGRTRLRVYCFLMGNGSPFRPG